MKLAILVTPIAQSVPDIEGADYIGVDAGGLKVLEKNKSLAFAVGDFDSMSEADFKRLSLFTECIRHPIEKDETDSELAIRLAFEKGYEKVILWGSFTGRMDHTFANVRLMMYRFPNLILMDECQRMMYLGVGEHCLKAEYKHCSFFAIRPSTISFSGLLYNVNYRKVDVKDIYMVSNSFCEEQAFVTVHEGGLLCIESNEK